MKSLHIFGKIGAAALAVTLGLALGTKITKDTRVRADENNESDVAIDETNFPDAAFRKFVKQYDVNPQDGVLSKIEREAVRTMDCSHLQIQSLDGIWYFKYLQSLDCSYNELTELSVTRIGYLRSLTCSHNRLENLTLAQRVFFENWPYALEYLDCSYNQLSVIDFQYVRKLKTIQISHNKLYKMLFINLDHLTNLDVSYNPDLQYKSYNGLAALTDLNFEGCDVKEVNLSKCTKLERLNCSNNLLSKLDLSNHKVLTELDCHLNALSELSLGSGVRIVNCSENALDTIDVSSCTSLSNLNCSLNFLTSKPAVPGSCTLKYDPQKKNMSGYVPVDKTVFPDPVFLDLVKDYDTNPKDGCLSTSELDAVTSIDCRNMSIRDLTGIGSFTKLTYLNCTENQLKNLDLGKNASIHYLYCSDNQIESLVLHPSANLTELLCANNKIASLDLGSTTNIRELDCRNNQLTSLNVSAFGKLEKLWISANKVTAIDVSKNPELTLLYLPDNRVSELDLSKNTKLRYLNCSMNYLKELDLSNNAKLYQIYCHTNGLKKLDLSNCPSLTEVDCKGNYLTAAPSVPSGCVLYYTPQLMASEEYVHIDGVNFPDENFRKCISETVDVSPKDGYLSKGELATDTIVCESSNISSLQGIELFTSLKKLYCACNDLSVLDVSVLPNLTVLSCSYNNLSTLDVSANTKLLQLYCDGNNLSTLDVSANTKLLELHCGRNPMGTLNVRSNAELNILWCHQCGLTSVDVSANTKLQKLHVENNELLNLDVSPNTKLEELWCEENQLTNLRIKNLASLTVLHCESNQLETLRLENLTNLRVLSCQLNQLETLDIEDLSNLKELNCQYNKLTSLNMSQNPLLQKLDCRRNEIVNLNLAANKDLHDLDCRYNELFTLDLRNCTKLSRAYFEYNYFSEKPKVPDDFNIDHFEPQKLKMAVSKVEVKTKTNTSITLSWDKVTLADGYEVYYSTALNGDYTLIFDSPYTSKLFGGLAMDTEYFYKVRAFVMDGADSRIYGAFSEVLRVRTVAPVTDTTVEVGKSFQYTVSGVPATDISWSVGNTSVATVDNSGKVTGRSVGNTYLHVGLPDGTKIKCLVRVVYPALKINYTEKTLHINQTFAFTVANASGQKITWSVGNTSVATVDANGKVTGKSAANTYLYAKSADGRVAKCLIKVVDPGVLGINYTEKTVYLGQSYTFKAKNAGILKPTWSVGNTAIATVDPSTGKVTSVSVGNTYLYVKTEDGRSARCLIKVVDPGPLNIRYTEKTIKVGESFQFTAKNPAGQTVTWRVGNTTVATVDANGVVTGKSVANTWLYASTPDGRETKCLLRIVA